MEIIIEDNSRLYNGMTRTNHKYKKDIESLIQNTLTKLNETEKNKRRRVKRDIKRDGQRGGMDGFFGEAAGACGLGLNKSCCIVDCEPMWKTELVPGLFL